MWMQASFYLLLSIAFLVCFWALLRAKNRRERRERQECTYQRFSEQLEATRRDP